MLKTFVLLSSILFSSQVLACAPTCFAGEEAFMVAKYGDAYRDDENLVIKVERHGKQDYHVATDRTSGTNAPLTLLMATPGKGLCEVLSTPPVATLKAAKFDAKGRPTVFVAKDQGTPSREITYVWDAASSTFKPQQCREVTWSGNKAVAAPVSCASLLAD